MLILGLLLVVSDPKAAAPPIQTRPPTAGTTSELSEPLALATSGLEETLGGGLGDTLEEGVMLVEGLLLTVGDRVGVGLLLGATLGEGLGIGTSSIKATRALTIALFGVVCEL